MAPSRIPKLAVTSNVRDVAKIHKEKATTKPTLKSRLLERRQGITVNDAPDSSFWDIEATENSGFATKRKSSKPRHRIEIIEPSAWYPPVEEEEPATLRNNKKSTSKIPVRENSSKPVHKPNVKATHQQDEKTDSDNDYIPTEPSRVIKPANKVGRRKMPARKNKMATIPKKIVVSSPSDPFDLPVSSSFNPLCSVTEVQDRTLVEELEGEGFSYDKAGEGSESKAQAASKCPPEKILGSPKTPIRMSQSVIIKAVAVPQDIATRHYTPPKSPADTSMGVLEQLDDTTLVAGGLEDADEEHLRTPSPKLYEDSVVSADAGFSITKVVDQTKIPSPKTPSHRLRKYLTDTAVPDIRARGRELTKRLRELGQQAVAAKRKAASPSERSITDEPPPRKVKVVVVEGEQEFGGLPPSQVRRRPRLAPPRPPMKLGKQKKKASSADPGSGTETSFAAAKTGEILTRQLEEGHRRREEELELRLQKIKREIKEQTLEAIEKFKTAYQTIERNNYAHVKQLLQGLSDEFGATDMRMNHIRWQYPKDQHHKALVNRYQEIAHRITVGVQEKKEASEKMKRIEAKVEESYQKCVELLDVIDGENYSVDFQYGVAIHGEAYMMEHYEAPKGYKTPANSTGIIPRLNHIQETITDMVTKEPNFTAHSEWFYQDLLKKAIEKVRNEEDEPIGGMDSE
ncbi:hypothetical protein TWF730_006378 [Orbilia blumenaviensis]|uniref:Uncharacterized protein n=1 Tax=Orbilia blumenaviensis TaxID=1796055 RepID=A0AAV9VGK8_9PEZI